MIDARSLESFTASAILARTFTVAASAFHRAAFAGASAPAFAFSFFSHFTPPFMFSTHIDEGNSKKTQKGLDVFCPAILYIMQEV
jgi:hypothetical protein